MEDIFSSCGMAGLEPAIHVFRRRSRAKAWMPGTKAGHDDDVVE